MVSPGGQALWELLSLAFLSHTQCRRGVLGVFQPNTGSRVEHLPCFHLFDALG